MTERTQAETSQLRHQYFGKRFDESIAATVYRHEADAVLHALEQAWARERDLADAYQLVHDNSDPVSFHTKLTILDEAVTIIIAAHDARHAGEETTDE